MMDLQFHTERIPFLNRILCETRTQEETAETVVPDSYPDIGSILDSYAAAVLRGKECSEGSVTISGGIKGGILYQSEGDAQLRTLEFYIPFSTRLSNPGLTETSAVFCDLRIHSVDGKMMNSRKAMLRAELSCCIWAWQESELPAFDLVETPPHLQIRQASYPLRLPLESCEKSVMITDALQLPVGSPPVVRVAKLHCRALIRERKIVGDKAVMKGEIHCKLLYLSEDLQLYCHHQLLPFSQYCQLSCDREEDTVYILPVLTGYDLDLEGQAPCRDGQFSVNLLLQCQICGKRVLRVVEDAFSTRDNLTPVWHDYEMTHCLDTRKESVLIRKKLPGNLQEIVDAEIYLDHGATESCSEQKCVRGSARISVLGKDSNGALIHLAGKTDISQTLLLDQHALCNGFLVQSGPVETAIMVDNVEVRCETIMYVSCFGPAPIRSLMGGTLEPEDQTSSCPAVILQRPMEPTPIWEIAKSNRANPEAIAAVNHLDGEFADADRMLLIPVG